MKCHVLSWSAPPPGRARVGCGHPCLLPVRDGGPFAARIACAPARPSARVCAGAVCAPDCAREPQGAPPPSRPAAPVRPPSSFPGLACPREGGGSGHDGERHDGAGCVMKCPVSSCAPPEMSCFVMFRIQAMVLSRLKLSFPAGPGVFRPAFPTWRFRHGLFLPIPLRSVLPAAGSSRAAGPCFARNARGRAFAPARFAHLIARARRRTHLPRPFLRGFSNMAPPAARCPRSGSGCRFYRKKIATLLSEVKQILEQKAKIFDISPISL